MSEPVTPADAPPRPIALDRFDLHAGAVRSTEPLSVESIPAQFSYTVSIPLSMRSVEAPLPLLIEADIVVHEGIVGAVVVAGDLVTVLSRTPAGVGPGRHRVNVIVEKDDDDARLVFRNYTTGDRVCVFTVEAMTIRPAPSDALGFASRLPEVMSGEPARISLTKLHAALDRTATDDHSESAVFELLRTKWSTVPAGLSERRSSADLATLSDVELTKLWLRVHEEATTGDGFLVRGWYHTIYRDVLRGKAVLEIGSGMGIDGIEFARHGAHLTFVDIVQSNLEVLARLCDIFGIQANFVYLDNFASLDALPDAFDVVWCQGSLINVPFDFSARECTAIVRHLKPGGRWIELAYPRERWERDGSPPFSIWGAMTDGEGTPWMEWYDLPRLLKRLAPARFEPVLALNFHNDDFNWFDLVKVQ